MVLMSSTPPKMSDPRRDAPGTPPDGGDRERIEGLVREGRLTRFEADRLLSALPPASSEDARTASLPKTTPADKLRLRFLRGQLTARELRDADRIAALRMGVIFGLLMLLLAPPLCALLSPGRSMLFCLFMGLFQMLFGGPLFGLVMHRVLLQPSTEKLVSLRAAAGAPLEPPAEVAAGQCPMCGAEEFDLLGPDHPTMRHWVWNPGLAFNELVLGQRVPREVRECRRCGTQSIDCDDCDRPIDAAEWRASSQFGRWRGLECPRCGGDIPCLRNKLAEFLLRPFRPGGPHPG